MRPHPWHGRDLSIGERPEHADARAHPFLARPGCRGILHTPTPHLNSHVRISPGNPAPRLRNAPGFSEYCRRNRPPKKDWGGENLRVSEAIRLVAWSKPADSTTVIATTAGRCRVFMVEPFLDVSLGTP